MLFLIIVLLFKYSNSYYLNTFKLTKITFCPNKDNIHKIAIDITNNFINHKKLFYYLLNTSLSDQYYFQYNNTSVDFNQNITLTPIITLFKSYNFDYDYNQHYLKCFHDFHKFKQRENIYLFKTLKPNLFHKIIIAIRTNILYNFIVLLVLLNLLSLSLFSYLLLLPFSIFIRPNYLSDKIYIITHICTKSFGFNIFHPNHKFIKIHFIVE